MTAAIGDFVKELETGLRQPGQWLPDHPVIGKIQRGELTRGQIAGMMNQIYRQTCEVVRWLGYLYAKCPIMAVRREIFNNLAEEELGLYSGTDGHFHLAGRVAVAAGADPQKLDEAPLLPATASLIRFGEEMFYEHPNWVMGFAAAFGFEYQSPMAYDALAKALKASYGMSDKDVEFFSVHVTADEDHTGAIVRVFERHATDDATRRDIKSVACEYGRRYHDMMSTYQAFA
jgi:pyrroloquinoline quinone (PQQ) biosynthesis protein C